MTIRNVGPNSPYPTIAAAVAASAAGDTIRLAAGYSNESALLTVPNLIVHGGASSLNIDLDLQAGINDVTLTGLADIQVRDNSSNNAITGNGGDNFLTVTRGADVVLGGAGLDRLTIDYVRAFTTVIGTLSGVTDGGANSVTFDDSVEDFIIWTGSGDDTLTTGDGNNRVYTGNGNDIITTGHGDSYISSGDGNDTVSTGDGNNVVFAGGGDNTVTTGAGADRVVVLSSDARGDDTLDTGSGDDRVMVMGGIDTLEAGLGHDLLRVDYSHLVSNVTGSMSAGSVADGYFGLVADSTGHYSVSFSGVEHFKVTTGFGNDDVRTGGGDDTLVGGRGDDFFHGAAGDDVLTGGVGADTLSGGRGQDVLTGGGSLDVFRFDDLDSRLGAADEIADLQRQDTIDLSRIDADTVAAGDQAFVFVSSFSGAAGEGTRMYQARNDVTRFSFDTNGDGAADIAIVAVGDHRTFDSFVL